MPFYSPDRQKLKYSALLFIALFVLLFSSLVYSSCPAFVQCSPAEMQTNPLCTQLCTVNFNVLLFAVIVVVSYLLPAAMVHHRNR